MTATSRWWTVIRVVLLGFGHGRHLVHEARVTSPKSWNTNVRRRSPTVLHTGRCSEPRDLVGASASRHDGLASSRA
jgi:hypothetical protein